MAGVRGVTSAIEIKRLGVDTLGAGASRTILTRYGIDGIVWGTEYAWLDASDRLAMFAAAGGGLSTKGVRADLVPSYDALMTIAARAALKDLAAVSKETKPIATGAIALVGATLDRWHRPRRCARRNRRRRRRQDRRRRTTRVGEATGGREAHRRHRQDDRAWAVGHARAPASVRVGVGVRRGGRDDGARHGQRARIHHRASLGDRVERGARAAGAARRARGWWWAKRVRRVQCDHARGRTRDRTPLSQPRVRADEAVLAARARRRRGDLSGGALVRHDGDGTHSDVTAAARRDRFGNGSGGAPADPRQHVARFSRRSSSISALGAR